MTRTLDDYLNIVFPSNLGQLSENIKLKELGFVVGIVNTAGAHTIAERNCNIVFI